MVMYGQTEEATDQATIDVTVTKYERVSPDDKPTPDGTVWVRGHVQVFLAEDADHEIVPVGLQPLVNTDSINDTSFITNQYHLDGHSMFLVSMARRKTVDGTFELLVPADEADGLVYRLNTGADDLWFQMEL